MFESLFKFGWPEFADGQIRFANAERPEWLLLAIAAGAGLAWLFYRNTPQAVPKGRRNLLGVLRGIAIASIVLFLLHPVLRLEHPSGRHRFVTVLADDSRSMSMKDEGSGSQARIEVARQVLFGGEGKESLRDGLEGHCAVKLFRFGSEPEPLEGPKDLNARGPATNLFRAMKRVRDEMKGIPQTAMVVLTDGAYNAGGAPHELARAMKLEGVPVFTVGFGSMLSPQDRAVIRVHKPREVRQNTEVEVFAIVRASGYENAFPVRLKDKDGEIVDEVEVPAGHSGVTRVKLKVMPDRKGTHPFTVEVPAEDGEKITDNNAMGFTLRVADKRLPVLYVEGSPREEYRFIRRALYKDKDFRIASILRTGAKFPIVQGSEPGDDIDDGFPIKKEHLFRFEAVIFGDIEAGYFSKEQLDMVEAFVKERGGGFLMLGGVNSLNLGGYQGTPMERMMPVTMEGPEVGYENKEMKLIPTKDGLAHPILHQSENIVENARIWGEAPVLIGINPLRGVKPGALLLASGAAQRPLIAVQDYGAGRSAVFATGGSWRWRMSLPIEQELHEKFWKQLVRWLAVGSKEKISVEVDKDIYVLGEPVELTATILGKQLDPVNDAQVTASVTDPLGNTREYRLSWVLSREGVYQTQFRPEEEGEYNLTVTAKFSDGGEETALTSFSVSETFAEFAELTQRADLLQEIASASGGEYFTPARAGTIVERVEALLKAQKSEEKIFEDKDLWDAPLCFGVVALALLAEWIIRRRSGLA